MGYKEAGIVKDYYKVSVFSHNFRNCYKVSVFSAGDSTAYMIGNTKDRPSFRAKF